MVESASQTLVETFAVASESLDLKYWPNFLPEVQATELLNALLRESPWKQPELVIYGRRVNIPRLTCWHGDANATYVYSGVRNEPIPWTSNLSALKALIEDLVCSRFNSVLLNLYRDGNDYMSWHRDDERELGERPEIASLSLGATRRFNLRQVGQDKKTGKKKTYGIELTHGSLLLMKGDTQAAWEHGIPKASGVSQPRINLTFRSIVPRVRQ